MFPSDMFLINIVVFVPLALFGFALSFRRRARNKRERAAAENVGELREHRGSDHLFCDYAEWQAGAEPTGMKRKIAPRITPLLCDASEDKLVLRAGYHVMMRRLAITLALIVLGGGMAKFAITDAVSYVQRGHHFTKYIEDPDGETRSVYVDHDATPWNYVLKKINQASLAYENRGTDLAGVASTTLELIAREFSQLGFYGSILGFILMLLSKAPAPIVIDRKRRLVYTWYRHRFWAAPWDKVRITRVEGHTRHTALAFALHDTKGKGGTRWFILSGAPAWGEKDDPRDRLLPDARTFSRWEGMRLWISEWVAGQRDPPPKEQTRRFALLHLLAPRMREVPKKGIEDWPKL
ncbi:hypothetical protein JMK10_19575 [Rhodovulum sulfidophilum]|uniref:hypothetical protein n=1 Tax=Rhodovulum sulfidophilum TaxID=35806 RepID=UPI001922F735|nr:hypothetical protein [Rhodovulum sulfidophilum]MBL3576269.1 hypothetical protein [Rhodovulum sulfidophilum]MCF4118922.1 hypothetical protein [Rhodovulum sulfidophilum]